jgi:hypothetical protein
VQDRVKDDPKSIDLAIQSDRCPDELQEWWLSHANPRKPSRDRPATGLGGARVAGRGASGNDFRQVTETLLEQAVNHYSRKIPAASEICALNSASCSTQPAAVKRFQSFNALKTFMAEFYPALSAEMPARKENAVVFQTNRKEPADFSTGWSVSIEGEWGFHKSSVRSCEP